MQVKNASAEELEKYPARMALMDAVKHMGWMVHKYETLEQDFPNLAWNSVMVKPLASLRILWSRRKLSHVLSVPLSEPGEVPAVAVYTQEEYTAQDGYVSFIGSLFCVTRQSSQHLRCRNSIVI